MVQLDLSLVLCSSSLRQETSTTTLNLTSAALLFHLPIQSQLHVERKKAVDIITTT